MQILRYPAFTGYHAAKRACIRGLNRGRRTGWVRRQALWRKVHPAGDNVFRALGDDIAAMGVGPLRGPDDGFPLFRLNIEVVMRKICLTTLRDVVQVGHPGQNAVRIAHRTAFSVR